ncbi:MAG: hypothetical protein WCO84_01430 [bacterium]
MANEIANEFASGSDIISRANFNSRIIQINTNAAIKSQTASKSSEQAKTLSSATWTGASAPFSYVLSVTGVTTTSNQEFLPSTAITQIELEALQGANIVDGGQTTGSITLKAWGDKPTVDIPIRVILRGDA